MQIGYLKAFSDNYIWFIQHERDLIVVDPGASSVVLDYIITNKLNLLAILLTHDHFDHIGGVADIIDYAPNVPVYGMGSIVTNELFGNENITICPWLQIKTIATPGHTYTGICYIVEFMGLTHIFTGDTLFAAGCGRVFTNDFVAMYKSLAILCSLQQDTLVYPGHEYTIKNLQFARFIEPNNKNIIKRIKFEQDKLDRVGNSLPVSMGMELLTNPFLRTNDRDIIDSVTKITEQEVKSGLDCFIKLRELRKDF
jgi:hydroxyacylglutathione hydrolase